MAPRDAASQRSYHQDSLAIMVWFLYYCGIAPLQESSIVRCAQPFCLLESRTLFHGTFQPLFPVPWIPKLHLCDEEFMRLCLSNFLYTIPRFGGVFIPFLIRFPLRFRLIRPVRRGWRGTHSHPPLIELEEIHRSVRCTYLYDGYSSRIPEQCTSSSTCDQYTGEGGYHNPCSLRSGVGTFPSREMDLDIAPLGQQRCIVLHLFFDGLSANRQLRRIEFFAPRLERVQRRAPRILQVHPQRQAHKRTTRHRFGNLW